MKTFYFWFVLSFLFLMLKVYSQEEVLIDFEDNTYKNHIRIDTTNKNNSWQVGTPNKNIFKEAYFGKNAIMTDTVKSYPPNDTSVFYVIHYPGVELDQDEGLFIKFIYKINSDSLKDYGFIEFSEDGGKSWINLLDSLFHATYEYMKSVIDTSIFTGSTGNYWELFEVPTSLIIKNHEWDSIMYKFVFISDSIDNKKDGWIIDKIYLQDWISGIDNHNLNTSIVYPNPVSGGSVTLKVPNPTDLFHLCLFNSHGKKVLDVADVNSQRQIQVGHLPKGIYFYKVVNSTGKQEHVGKLVID